VYSSASKARSHGLDAATLGLQTRPGAVTGANISEDVRQRAGVC
jgi:hypothetical protein